MRVYHLEPAPIKKVQYFLQKVCNLQNNDYLASDLKSNLININIMINKFTLYMGLNDQDSKRQEISTIEAYKITTNMLAANFGGGTIFEAEGIYKHDDGSVVIEKTLRIEILFAELPAVRAFVADLKKVFNQESIAVQHEQINSDLW